MDYRDALRTLETSTLSHQLWFDGPERYLIDDFIGKIKHRLNLSSDDFNVLTVDGKDSLSHQVFDFVLSPPLFAESKLLIIRQADLLKLSDEQWRDLTSIDDSLYICYIAGSAKAIPKQLKKIVTPVTMKKINRSDMQKWLTKQFRLRNKRIGLDQITRIMDRTRYFEYNSTTDLLFLIQEVEKLSATDEAIITSERIDRLLGRPLEDNVFTLLQHVLEKDAHKTFLALNEYLASGANLFMLIPMLSRNFYQLHIIKKLSGSGYPNRSLGERVSIKSDFILKRMITVTKKLTLEQIQNDMNLCLRYEKTYKSETVQIRDHVSNLLLDLMQ